MNESGSSGRNSLAVWLLLALVAAGAFGALLLRPKASRVGTKHPSVGRKLPRIRLQALAGPPRTIDRKRLLGNVTLINLWGPWCPVCLHEFPHLLDLERSFRPQADFQFLAVASSGGWDHPDELADLEQSTEAFLRDLHAEIAVYADPDAETRRALYEIGAFDDGYPTTIVLDRQGVLRGVWMGFVDGDQKEMRSLVAQLLQHK